MKSTLLISKSLHSAKRCDKYIKNLSLELGSKQSRLMASRNLKSVSKLTISSNTSLKTSEYNKLRTHTTKFSKTVQTLSVTSDDKQISISQFSNVSTLSLDLEPNSPTSPTDEAPKKFSFNRIATFGKLRVLTVTQFAWDRLHKLKRFTKLESLHASSTLEDMARLTDKDFNNTKASGLKYFITITSSEYSTPVSLPIRFLERIKSLSIPNNMHELPIIGTKAHHMISLKNLSCTLNANFLSAKAETLDSMAYLRNLDSLNIELTMNSQSSSDFLGHLVLPLGISQLKITVANCKYSVLENADTSTAYFESLRSMKNLKAFEFEAFRLSLFKESKTTCINFIKNTLKCFDNQLQSLSLKAPPVQSPDDEFYELILSQSNLQHLELGIPVNASNDINRKISNFKGSLKSLKLSNNSLLFEALPKDCLSNLEELYLYLGIHTELADDEKIFQHKYLMMLKRIKTLKNIENLSLYNSVAISKGKGKILKGLKKIMGGLDSLKNISVGMRSMKIAEDEKCALESMFTKKKSILSHFKFSNFELVTA